MVQLHGSAAASVSPTAYHGDLGQRGLLGSSTRSTPADRSGRAPHERAGNAAVPPSRADSRTALLSFAEPAETAELCWIGSCCRLRIGGGGCRDGASRSSRGHGPAPGLLMGATEAGSVGCFPTVAVANPSATLRHAGPRVTTTKPKTGTQPPHLDQNTARSSNRLSAASNTPSPPAAAIAITRIGAASSHSFQPSSVHPSHSTPFGRCSLDYSAQDAAAPPCKTKHRCSSRP